MTITQKHETQVCRARGTAFHSRKGTSCWIFASSFSTETNLLKEANLSCNDPGLYTRLDLTQSRISFTSSMVSLGITATVNLDLSARLGTATTILGSMINEAVGPDNAHE